MGNAGLSVAAIPVRGHRSVRRERLELRLARTDARLILVSAPAGFGKTTLLSDWLRGGTTRVAWLTLEPRDSNVRRFSRRLLAALSSDVNAGQSPVIEGNESSFDIDVAADGLAAGLIALAPDQQPIDVVLDDYHVISSADVHRLVASLVERVPPGARIVIATRADPPLPLARLRAGGDLLEVRADDLRFTPDEAGELLRLAGLDLRGDSVASLAGRTEGWAAVLRLAAISLQGRTDAERYVERFGAAHRFVLDYVVEEVLARLPADTEAFLLETSIVSRLNGSLADAITGGADGQARLEALERANLLIVPLDDQRCWYRYHALFADILRARLAITLPDAVGTLHGRASAWWEAEGDIDEAIAHAIRAGDVDRASTLITAAGRQRLNAGELSTVRSWLDALPPEAFARDPQLSVSYAWCIGLAGETDGIERWLCDAEATLARQPASEPEAATGIRIQVALLRSRDADLRGDPARAIEQARLARRLVEPLPAAAAAPLRGLAAGFMATALRHSGDTAAAEEAYLAALPDLRLGSSPFAVARAVADLASLAIDRGDPDAALRLCEEELERRGDGAETTASGALWAAKARARLELHDLDAAEEAAERTLALAQRTGDGVLARSAELTLAGVAQARSGPRPGARGAGVGAESRGTGLIEPLSARELEVLRLVALGRSNSQVAAELFITVGTVKSHLHTISGKLGAANRVEAVARAREVGLLS